MNKSTQSRVHSGIDPSQTPTDTLERVDVRSQGQQTSPFEGIQGEETSAHNTLEILIIKQTTRRKRHDMTSHGLKFKACSVFI